jgi:hypothetical protein
MIISYLYRDQDLSEAQSLLKVPAATTFADAETFGVTNLLPLMNALCDTIPYGVNIIQRRNRDLAPVDGAGEGEKKGTFLVVNDARGQPTTRISVPGLNATLLKGDRKTIDQDDAAVDEFLNALITGTQADGTTPIVAGVTGCVSRRGNAFISSDAANNRAKAAYKYHVASGSGSRRRSS